STHVMMKRISLLLFVWLAFAATAGAAPWAGRCIQTIAAGQTVNGSLTTSDCNINLDGDLYYTDVYVFTGIQGQQIAIDMSSNAFDTWLELHSVNETADDPLETDDDGGGDTNSRIPPDGSFFILPASGTYYIWATTAFADDTGAYTIRVSEPGDN